MDSSQLLPYGTEQSMKGYAISFGPFRDYRFHEILLLVTKLLGICGRSIIPPLFEVDRGWPLGITHLTIRLIDERAETLGQDIDVSIQLSWLQTLMHIIDFCGEVTDLAQVNHVDISAFVSILMRFEERNESRGCGLLFVCDVILSLFDVGTTLFTPYFLPQLRDMFSRYGATLYTYKPDEDATEYHSLILQNFTKESRHIVDPVRTAFDGFVWASMARQCGAPECQETFATAKRPFARCRGCGVLRYCSRECQRRSWKHAELPHRAICTKPRMLKERTQLPKSQDLNRTRDYDPFVEACRADGALVALAQVCGEHLQQLMLMQHKNSLALAPEVYRTSNWREPMTGGDGATAK